MNDFLTTREAARALGIPYTTLMNRLYAGKIAATRKGRYWYVHVNTVALINGAPRGLAA